MADADASPDDDNGDNDNNRANDDPQNPEINRGGIKRRHRERPVDYDLEGIRLAGIARKTGESALQDEIFLVGGRHGDGGDGARRRPAAAGTPVRVGQRHHVLVG